jgi:hypothetical protein
MVGLALWVSGAVWPVLGWRRLVVPAALGLLTRPLGWWWLPATTNAATPVTGKSRSDHHARR